MTELQIADSRTVLRADRVVADSAVLSPGWVAIEEGLITDYGQGNPTSAVRDRIAGTIVPGFVDVHAHGAAGADFGSADEAGIGAIVEHHARCGTTTLVASVATAPLDVLEQRVRNLRLFVERGILAGIHLEGPYLSPQRRGAHDIELLRHPEPAEMQRLLDAGAGTIRMVTIAPELPGAEVVIRSMVAQGVTVALGHTACTAEEARAAIEWGATVLTHAFNGMPSLHHREPGPLGVALVDDRVTVELILDGHHVGTEAAEIIRRVAVGRLALVSDAMAATGLGDGEYRIAGSPVVVRDGVAMLADGSSLAGSTITIADGFQRLMDVHGAGFAEAVMASSETPARALGLPRPGIWVGAPADLVVLQGSAVEGVMRAGTWLQ